ncbi:DUF2075 domain-containing protein [Candidatus Dependentiae bacterium]|nr:DUF2075 domain-containing protein [Candidatus Dependentiae bacterium]
MKRSFYSDTLEDFFYKSEDEILGILTRENLFPLELSQRNAWQEEIIILKKYLRTLSESGKIYFEYSIPRMGKRIDVLLLIRHIIFIIEFKIGENEFSSYAVDQVFDYSLDMKNFHETSHDKFIVPILIATNAPTRLIEISMTHQNDKLVYPIKCNYTNFYDAIKNSLILLDDLNINPSLWESGRYCPTPTIVEAAMALYNGHSVEEISRSDASAFNLSTTTKTISSIIEESRNNSVKSICFVTGVPGAGKTLVGLNIATTHIDRNSELYSVFLSGNGPLVAVLQEALTRDKVKREKERGNNIKIGQIRSEVKMFIQNVHNFRDECLKSGEPPIEHVTLFDEAQRAWDSNQTSNFMARKKGVKNFDKSEPEFLISCLDRHKDWAVIVCLVGGGQEINTGEAGISEWLNSLDKSFSNWNIYISSQLMDTEYAAFKAIKSISQKSKIIHKEELHLSTSMRSFRAENLSLLVKQILDIKIEDARKTYVQIKDKYPIVLTRDLKTAKQWLKKMARGSERYGIVVSSQAERLKPHAIDVKTPVDPIHWFLDPKEDVRSSYYLEDVATEFQIQGLELDWACVTWDADLRYAHSEWQHWSFRGDRWMKIHKEHRQKYLLNAYRVLLTRARQGMVIVVPPGDNEDHTRPTCYYDPIFEYLKSIEFEILV